MSDEELGLRGPTAEANFVLRMRLLREARGLSQAEVAARATRLGVSMPQQTIARIETGKRTLRLDEAEVIARVLGSELTHMASKVVEVTDADRQFAEAKQRRHELSTALFDAEAALERHLRGGEELRQRVSDLQAAYAEAEAAEQALWQQTPEGERVAEEWREAAAQNLAALDERIDGLTEESDG